MRITSDGKVGIGTSSPTEKLQVAGNVHVTGNLDSQSGTGRIRTVNGGGSYTALMIADSGAGNAGIYMDASNGDFTGGDYAWIGQQNDKSLEIRTESAAGDIVFRVGGNEITRLTPAGRIDAYNNTSRHYHMGWIPSIGSRYIHIKTNVTHNNKMVSFFLKGQMYSGNTIMSHICMYTYSGTTYGGATGAVHSVQYVNHNPSNYGFRTPYYSTDNYLVLVVDMGGTRNYSGMVLESTSGTTHYHLGTAIVGTTTSVNTTGAW